MPVAMVGMKKLAVVIATLAGVTGAPAAEPVVRFPNTLTFYAAVTACLPPYFQCDYITNICTSGRSDGKQFAGVVLSNADRQTVLFHVYCSAPDTCINFDTGLATLHGVFYPPADLKTDMLPSKVKPYVERAHRLCPH